MMDLDALRQRARAGDRASARDLYADAQRRDAVDDWRLAVAALGDLDAILSLGPLSPPQAHEVLEHLLEDLVRWHRRGALHGRVAPAWTRLVHLGPHDPDLRVVLRRAAGEQPPPRASALPTADLERLASYLAPECWDDQPLTPAVDIYALGCLVHALLTGAPPFTGPIEAVREAHLTATLDLGRLPLDASPASQALRGFMASALVRRPADGRWIHAQATQRALRAQLAPTSRYLASVVHAEARLVYHPSPRGPEQVATLNPRRPRLLIGRDGTCDLALPEVTGLSRRHACVRYERGLILLGDPPGASREPVNGTFINGERKPFGFEVTLQHRDEVRLGPLSLAVLTRDDPPDVATVSSVSHLPSLPTERRPSLSGLETSSRWPRLVYLDLDTGEERTLRLGPHRPEVAVGRSDACALQLSHPSVSRVHALIRYQDEGCVLLDPPSPPTNGTFIDGERKANGRVVPLARAHELRFGQVPVLFQPAGLRAPAAPGPGEDDAGDEDAAATRALSDARDAAESRCRDLVAQNTALATDLDDRDSLVARLEARVDHLETVSASLSSQITALKARQAHLTDLLGAARDDRDRLEERAHDLAQQLASRDADAPERDARLKQLARARDDLKSELGRRDRTLADVQRAHDRLLHDLGVERDNVQTLLAQHARLRQQNAHLEATCASLRQLIDDDSDAP